MWSVCLCRSSRRMSHRKERLVKLPDLNSQRRLWLAMEESWERAPLGSRALVRRTDSQFLPHTAWVTTRGALVWHSAPCTITSVFHSSLSNSPQSNPQRLWVLNICYIFWFPLFSIQLLSSKTQDRPSVLDCIRSLETGFASRLACFLLLMANAMFYLQLEDGS